MKDLIKQLNGLRLDDFDHGVFVADTDGDYLKYADVVKLLEQLPQQSAEGLINEEDFEICLSGVKAWLSSKNGDLDAFCYEMAEALHKHKIALNDATTPLTDWVDRDKACKHVGKLAMVYNHEGYPVNGEIWESPFDGFAILDRVTGFYIAIPPSGFFILPQAQQKESKELKPFKEG